MSSLLWRSVLRHLLHHPWQLVLSVLGIALGVAVVLAVDLTNASAQKSFLLSMEQITGRATHQIVSDAQNVPEILYSQLRLKWGLRNVAPVVTGYAAAANKPGRLFQILGVDPFAEAPFRAFAGNRDAADANFIRLLTEPATALFPSDVEQAESLELRIGEKHARLHSVGRLDSVTAQGLIITDISTAQDLFNKSGRLNYIDLILPEGLAGKELAAKLQGWLPPTLRLESIAQRNQATTELSAAFSLNLTAMSLLALVVGMFLIYNTITFSVVQRRSLLGLLRALGVTRGELFATVLGEALVLGIAGTLLGSLLGLWLGSTLVHLVTRTINDLYYEVPAQAFYIMPLSFAKVALLGIGATLAAAFLPALEAASAPPGATLSRIHLETRWRAALPFLSLAGLAFLALGGSVLALLPGLVAAFAGLFLMIFGCGLLTPGTIVLLVSLTRRPLIRSGPLLRMAIRDMERHLSRTGVAVAALMIAVSATIGVGVMVDSFRSGVTLWIKDLINADIYIAPPGLENGGASSTLRPQVLSVIRNTRGVAAMSTYRRNKVNVDGRPVQLLALDPAPAAKAGYRLIAGQPETVWHAFDTAGAVVVSEPLAYRRQIHAGEHITLPTPSGPRTFPVAGVFLDYGSEHGRILMQRSTYQRFWNDAAVDSVAIYTAPKASVTPLRERLENRVGHLQKLIMRSNRDIQAFTLAVFERTFTITNVLRLLAVIVAFVGILSALLAMQLERAREFAILRATGMTVGEVGWLVSLQTGFMGLLAGLLSIPVGLGLAAILIFVINRRAFGWTLPFEVDFWILVQAVLLAIIAALLAGIYPIRRMALTHPADALREE